MPLLCPVCLEDKDGPLALPGCRLHHTQLVKPPVVVVAPPVDDHDHDALKKKKNAPSHTTTQVPPFRTDDATGLSYASKCCIPTSWTPLSLLKRRKVNYNTEIFTFALPEGNSKLMLPVCGCLLMRAPDCEHGGGDAVRPYTPVSSSNFENGFEIMLKLYEEWGDKRHMHSYCPPGAVSNHVFGLKVGDSVDFKHIAANVKIPYYHTDGSPPGFKGANRLTLIAVGVGIAPMIQVLHEVLDNNEDDTAEVVLLYGNRTVDDILMADLLNRWERDYASRFRVIHHIGSRYQNVLMHFDDCPKDCGKPCKRRKFPDPVNFDQIPVEKRERGWISEETIAKHGFPADDPTHRVMVCGLPNVYRTICGPRGTKDLAPGSALANLGFTKEQVVKF
ncbi:NADH-cytochrome b5 reductase 2 [Pycnococcus provasolii]